MLVPLATAVSAQQPPAQRAKALQFPQDRNCGTVSIIPEPVIWGQRDRGAQQNVRHARGVLVVRRDSLVELDINRAGAADLGFLNALPADSIHSLVITGAKLGAAEFASIARFTSLRELGLNDCQLAPKVEVSGMPAAPALQWLNFSVKGEPGRKLMTAWVARCPKIEYVYDQAGSLDVSALRQFRGHPTLDFVTVDFGADAIEVIQALCEIPHLRGLNVHVKREGYEAALPKLKNVELFNWNGGRIDAKTLKALGQLPRLRKIRFQSRAKIEPDFAQGLKFLEHLEELDLNGGEDKCPTEELQTALCVMKRLTNWPRISHPTKQTLDVMAARGNLKRIELEELGTGATVAQVVKLCQSNPLEWVDLRKISFTAELGDALALCHKLQYLSLDLESFDGNALRHPEEFGHLTHLFLNAQLSPVNLAPLGRLPNLTSLEFNTESLQPCDYQFVAASRSLKSLSTFSNIVNDRAIKQIAQSKSLDSLYLGENCVLSDEGLEQLIQCRQLINLAVDGVLSVEGIRKLDQIPGLKSLWVSSLLSPADRSALQAHFAHLSSASFEEFRSPYGTLRVGADGIWREDNPKSRFAADALEGKSLRTILGSALPESLEKDLRGKVVLVDFWGTWCEPCLTLFPELKRLQDEFGKDQFAILGIHTQKELEALDGYQRKNPKLWPNLRDSTGSLDKAFAVPHYPSLYLIDRQGTLRVALSHRLGLESAIRKLLDQ
ncbi:MAG TPA: thioredoxin-like domain-containing protein [Planctomycetaceae bacterium]|nr:thioredoxin-like domain-containing protein [Planctomycetaceae bacterium]